MMVWALKSKAMAHQWLLSCVGESVGLSGNMRRSSVLSGILRMADVWSMLDILGGLRSACTYVGAQRLKELSKRTTFLRVTQQLNEVFAAEKNIASSSKYRLKVDD